MRDTSLGLILVGGSLTIMIGYFLWVFGPYIGVSWISKELSEWGIRLPVILAVYIGLAIVLWIGYTMITTPSPIPTDKPLEIQRDEKASKAQEQP